MPHHSTNTSRPVDKSPAYFVRRAGTTENSKVVIPLSDKRSPADVKVAEAFFGYRSPVQPSSSQTSQTSAESPQTSSKPANHKYIREDLLCSLAVAFWLLERKKDKRPLWTVPKDRFISATKESAKRFQMEHLVSQPSITSALSSSEHVAFNTDIKPSWL